MIALPEPLVMDLRVGGMISTSMGQSRLGPSGTRFARSTFALLPGGIGDKSARIRVAASRPA